MGVACAVTSCLDRATWEVRFHYGYRQWLDVRFCSHHSWPWRAGRGSGQADVTRL